MIYTLVTIQLKPKQAAATDKYKNAVCVTESRYSFWVNTFTCRQDWGQVTTSYLLLLTYFTEQSPSWEDDRFSASQEISAFYETPIFITAFTSASHMSLSWAKLPNLM